MTEKYPAQMRRISGLFLLFSLLLIVFLSSCKDEVKHEIVIDLNTKIMDPVSGLPFTGTVTDTIEGLIVTYEVIEGVKNGIFKIFYSNGSLQIEGVVKNNKNEGLWKYYYPNLQVESEGKFKNDRPDQKWVWYYPDGEIKEVGFFNSGLKEGKWTLYDEDGNITKEITFVNDQIVNTVTKPKIITL